MALRPAMVRIHARRLAPASRRWYARSAERNVSWKQSSALSGPTVAARNRYTRTRCSSRNDEKGGTLIALEDVPGWWFVRSAAGVLTPAARGRRGPGRAG